MIWILVLIFFFTRLVNLTLIPIFADEAIYIRWAQLISNRFYNFFVPLSDGKTPLFMWLLAPLLKLDLDPLLAGRLLSVAAGLLTLTGVYFLSRNLFSKTVAVLAVTLAIFQPFLLFYDRLSLVDSLLTGFIIWSYFVWIKLLKSPKLIPALILGCLWAATLLTKPSGLLYLFLSALFLFTFPLKTWIKKLKSVLPFASISLLLAGGIYNLQRLSHAFYMISRRSLDYLRTLSEFTANGHEYIPDTTLVMFGWLIDYLAWPVIILLFFSLYLALRKKQIQPLILFFITLIVVLTQAVIGKIIYPRYLLPIIPFILITASWGLTQFNRRIKFMVLILIIFSWLKFDYLLLTDPVSAPLNSWEKNQYFSEWSSGYGLKEITQYLKALPQSQPILVATEGSFGTLPDGLTIYFDPSDNIQILGVGFPETTVSPGMEQALKEGKKVFLVVNAHRYNLSASSRLTLIAEYIRPGGEKLVFYEVN